MKERTFPCITCAELSHGTWGLKSLSDVGIMTASTPKENHRWEKENKKKVESATCSQCYTKQQEKPADIARILPDTSAMITCFQISSWCNDLDSLQY